MKAGLSGLNGYSDAGERNDDVMGTGVEGRPWAEQVTKMIMMLRVTIHSVGVYNGKDSAFPDPRRVGKWTLLCLIRLTQKY